VDNYELRIPLLALAPTLVIISNKMGKFFTLMLVLVMISSSTKGQDKLVRIKESSYYTENENVYFVVSNKFNSSGMLCPVEGIVSEIYITKKEEVAELFGNKGSVLDLDDFLKNYLRNHYYFEHITIAIKIPDISLDGFNIIERNYASYKNRIFYEYDELKEVDFNSFEIINNKWDNNYAKDKNAVFYRAKKIINSNPKSFEILKEHYAKDNTHVYRVGELLKNADPESFQILSYTYQKDNYQVWSMGKPINADVKTFELVKYKYPGDDNEQISLYAIDKNHVYFQGDVIPEADVQTFKLVCSDAPYQEYGIDKNYVYYDWNIIEGADTKTFTVVNKKTSKIQYDAYDKKYHYFREEKKLSPIKNKRH
jgi:hypothetical protein